jgi:hypothetical protein
MQASELRSLFTYADGFLYWKPRSRTQFKNGAGWHNFNTQFAGVRAGWVNNGRREIKIKGKTYKASRVVWAFHYSEWPLGMIDHINGNSLDDRIENLRLATPRQNAQNRSMRTINSSGFTGVTWHSQRKKWWVRVTVEGKTRSFGLYKDLSDACLIACDARKRLFGVFARDA